ncbi:MAG: hypothetical protein ACP5MH_10300 [Thermoproteus sp.]
MVSKIDKLVCLRRVVDFLLSKTTVDGKIIARPWLSLWRNEVYAICGEDVGDTVWLWLVRRAKAMGYYYSRTRKILFFEPPYWRLYDLVLKVDFEGKMISGDGNDLRKTTAAVPHNIALAVRSAATGVSAFVAAALQYYLLLPNKKPEPLTDVEKKCKEPLLVQIPRRIYEKAVEDAKAYGISLAEYIANAVAAFAGLDIERRCETDVEIETVVGRI